MILRPAQKVLEKHGLNSLPETDLIVYANKTELIEVLKPLWTMYLMPSVLALKPGCSRRRHQRSNRSLKPHNGF